MGQWLIAVVDEDGTYAEHGSLYGSIVETDDERPGRVKGRAGWAGVRYTGTLLPGLSLRAPKNREERKAVEATRMSSEMACHSGSAMLDAQYAAAKALER